MRSAQGSMYFPVNTKTSASFRVFMSDGRGSKVWLSTPGGRSIRTDAWSPAICRTKSYCGKRLHTTESFRSPAPAPPAAVNARTRAQRPAANILEILKIR